MTVEELLKERKALAARVTSYLEAELRDFHAKTGVGVKAFNVETVDTTSFTGGNRVAIGLVDIELDI